eukprot:TRINITY_DN41805_c0_g1_i1.p1 TRINITY_DN41805_c0_g1~~TRINITY_DN41805_c0_g1_i1.p1  ORF type:complete len:1169 (-),score=204.86 TRINITY_DN41805_c0_g1_i1:53-3559(-)
MARQRKPFLLRVLLVFLLVVPLGPRFLMFLGPHGPRCEQCLRRSSARRCSPQSTIRPYSEQLDAWLNDTALLAHFEDAPRFSEARTKMRSLFSALSVDNSSMLPYDRALSFVLAMRQSKLSLPRQTLENLRSDALGFLVTLDHDKDGAVTLDEFIEYLATFVQVFGRADRVGDATDWPLNRVSVYFRSLKQTNETDWVPEVWNEFNFTKNWVLSTARRLGMGGRDLSDSIDMLSQDIRYCKRLVQKMSAGEILSGAEASLIRRTISDAVALVPLVAIAVMPLPLVGHAVLFTLIKVCAPQLFPSAFSESRLELVRGWRQVRRHPEFKDWTMFGDAPSEELDTALSSIFKAPAGATAARSSIRELFEELDSDTSGNLTHVKVLSIVQGIWSGNLNLPKRSMEDFRMDASALMVAVDRKNAGSLTLGEFTLYLETLVEVAHAYTRQAQSSQRKDLNVTVGAAEDRATSGQNLPDSSIAAFLEDIATGTKDLSESFSMLNRDLWYAAFLIKTRILNGTLSKVEQAMLGRTGQDVASCLPYAAILLTRITPIVKILLCLLVCKNVPNLFPSSFKKTRRRFARAWRSIAVKQRIRACEDWQAFEQKVPTELDQSCDVDAILEQEDAILRRQLIGDFFERFGNDGSGTLTYGKVLEMSQRLWSRGSEISSSAAAGSLLNSLALLILIARDSDGAVTKTEFIEFIETLVTSVQQPTIQTPSPEPQPAVEAQTTWQQRLRNMFSRVKKVAQHEVQELVDSMKMLSSDVGGCVSLLKGPRGETRWSKTESLLLRRGALDFILFLPLFAIIVAPLTPVGTALTISLVKHFLPAVVPSSFRKARLDLMKARRELRSLDPSADCQKNVIFTTAGSTQAASPIQKAVPAASDEQHVSDGSDQQPSSVDRSSQLHAGPARGQQPVSGSRLLGSGSQQISASSQEPPADRSNASKQQAAASSGNNHQRAASSRQSTMGNQAPASSLNSRRPESLKETSERPSPDWTTTVAADTGESGDDALPRAASTAMKPVAGKAPAAVSGKVAERAVAQAIGSGIGKHRNVTEATAEEISKAADRSPERATEEVGKAAIDATLGVCVSPKDAVTRTADMTAKAAKVSTEAGSAKECMAPAGKPEEAGKHAITSSLRSSDKTSNGLGRPESTAGAKSPDVPERTVPTQKFIK